MGKGLKNSRRPNRVALDLRRDSDAASSLHSRQQSGRDDITPPTISPAPDSSPGCPAESEDRPAAPTPGSAAASEASPSSSSVSSGILSNGARRSSVDPDPAAPCKGLVVIRTYAPDLPSQIAAILKLLEDPPSNIGRIQP
jgi:hypothetical protein